MAHIIIMGAGIGGVPAAYELRELLGKGHRITVVNATDYFQFVPSNPWVAVGWRERQQVTVPIAPYLARKGIEFVGSAVTRIDAPANRLTLQNGSALDYDYLVITTGPKLSFAEVPGAGPVHGGGGGFTHSVCTVDHAQAFFADYEEFLKNPGPVVIGAMPGASCFGPAYEFAFILDTDLRKRKLRHKVPMTYVSSEPYIGHLGLGGVGLGRASQFVAGGHRVRFTLAGCHGFSSPVGSDRVILPDRRTKAARMCNSDGRAIDRSRRSRDDGRWPGRGAHRGGR